MAGRLEIQTPQGQGAGAVDDAAQRLESVLAAVVEVDVQADAVPVGDAEDQVELVVGGVVEADRVDATDHVDQPRTGGLLQQLRGAGLADDAVLRERHDLHVEGVPQSVTGRG